MSESKKPTPPEEGEGVISRWRSWFVFGLIIAVVLLFQLMNSSLVSGQKPLIYSEFKQKVAAGEVASVALFDTYAVVRPTDGGLKTLNEGAKKDDTQYTAWRVQVVRDDRGLIDLLEANKVKYEAQYANGCDGESLAGWIFPLLMLLLLWQFVFRRMNLSGGGTNPAMGFGKSNAKLNLEQATGVTFEDVAGCDEAKDELVEIVHFLKEPERFTRLGGKVPKGVLLVGPPGTGKTLLARAVAGEADVAFFNLSGSDFVEMFVGVGAARVRDLFAQAKTHAPCIIFVDELDAIGKSRTNQMQSNEEREQTLNALLVEMDGFESNANVILLAATNRPEVLDPALLRPGRFDRQVVVDRPDVKGRHQILKVHARRIVMSEELNLEEIAKQTPGFVGADLANIVNEAALLAARKGKDAVETADFNEAIERVIAGLEKKSRRLNEKEKNIVAYHESGHAIVSKAIEGTDRVHKVSIVSRGIAALGYTLQIPDEDRYLMTHNEILAKICGLLGGRAAEQIVFKDISTGASNDLQRVTDLARRIVVDYGMSAVLGNVSYGDGESYLGNMGVSSRKYSEKTAETIDEEVQKIIHTMYERTLAILRENNEILIEMSERLKEIEVLENADLAGFLDRVKPFREMGFDGSTF